MDGPGMVQSGEVREVISWKPLSNQIMWSEVSYLIIRRWGWPARHGQGTGSDSPYCLTLPAASDKKKSSLFLIKT